MTPGAFCPFCGAPVTVAGARFCNVCGRDMAASIPPTAGATPVAPTAPTAPTTPGAAWPGTASPAGAPAYAPPAYMTPAGAPMYAAPATAPVVVVQNPKSQGVAILLELLLSGAGALYLGRIGQGLGWLFGSLIGGGIAGAIISNIATSSSNDCAPGYESACGPDFNTVLSAIIIVGVLSVAWLVVRIVIVSNQARAMAMGQPSLVYGANGLLVAQQAPLSKPSVNRALVIGLGVGLAVLTFVLIALMGYSANTFLGSGIYLAAAYVLAIRRLSQVSWKRTALEAGLLMVGLEVVWLLIWPGVLRYDSYYMGPYLVYALVGIVVNVLVGTAVAQWSAPWSVLRTLHTSSTSQRFGPYAALVVVGVLIVWAIPQVLYRPYAFAPGLPSELLAMISALAIIVMAIVETNRLQRLTESAV